MKPFSFLIIAVLSFFISGNAQRNYYFNSETKTEGKGTEHEPFGSLESLPRITLKAGDTVFFHGSDTLDGNILLSNIPGNKEQEVVFTSYGKQKGIINGKNKEAFVITGSNYFQISNLILIGSGRKTGNTTNGLKLVDCAHSSIMHLDISGFQKSGLLLYDCEAAEVNDVYAHENGATGILIEGEYKKHLSKNIHIANCRADDNPGDPTNLDNHSGNGIIAGNCRNVLIEYCTATNNGWDMPRIGNGPVGIWAYEADSVIIQHCISYRNKTAKGAADGGGFDLDGGVTNSVVQYCLSYENWGSGYGIYQYYSASNWYNNTVRYCISINDGFVTDEASAMYMWNGWNGDSSFTHFYAYNNFFYNDKAYAFGFSSTCQHKQFYFFNNVFVAADTSDIFNGIDSSTTDRFLGNVWTRKSGGFMQNGFSDIEKWSKASGYEQHDGKFTGTALQQKLFDLTEYINITDPYRLKTDSLLLSICNNALRDKGVDIPKIFGIDTGGTDFFGHPVHSNEVHEPGACEAK